MDAREKITNTLGWMSGLGSKADLTAPKRDFRYTPKSR
jgi:hypothetical protein